MEYFQLLRELRTALWVPLKCQINYFNNFQENFELLNREAEDLNARREDVEREIEGNTVSKMPTSECKSWLKKVDEIKNKVNLIEVEFKENKKCLGESCPNIWWRIKLSKCMMTMKDDIAKLRDKSKFDSGVVVIAPPKTVEPTNISITKAETSIRHTVREILECLRDEKIGKIGVWGMSGVGKTTVLDDLTKSPEIIQMFQIVIWVTVSKDCSVKNMQKDIADRLSLKFDDVESENRVSRKLFQEMEPMKYLLLLDDVWDRVDLNAVGVPHPTRKNGCKIVLTSRFLDLCRQMETNKNIKVEVLSKKEAWDLFHEKVGDVVNYPNIEPLARTVVEECGGLPLVLVVIGRSLRMENNVHVWRNALTELRKATFQVGADMEMSVFMQLKFSYDRLKDNNVKNCFLYCALYPEDCKILVAELIEHWWVEGFIDNRLNFGEVYDKGHTIFNDLTNACLLEKIENHCHQLVKVRMHDMIRDMALKITSPEGEGVCRFVGKAGAGITDLPNEEDWEQAQRLSLMYNDLKFIHKRLECTLLTTLLLQKNYKLVEIPKSLLEHMHSLRVLNLSNTNITKLPSLAKLASLRGLFLGSCRWLSTLPSEVGHLSTLEVLHLETIIKYLPIEVGQLTRLRSLRVLFNNKYCATHPAHIIPDGLLSRLTLLEDLHILMDEETLRKWFSEYTIAVVEELISLKHLISLGFHFPNVEYLEYFLRRSFHWNKGHFKSFWFVVNIFDMTNYVSDDRYMKSSSFLLKNNERYEKLSDLCSVEMMNGLQSCTVKYCNAIETLIDGNGLASLEELYVEELPELRTIWGRSVQPQSLTFLRKLVIWYCAKVSNLFSPDMINHLSNLENLSVKCCPEIAEIVNEEEGKEIVVDNEDEVEVVLFPRLKKLHLSQLPKLVRICKQVRNPTAWPSLQNIYIWKCQNLKNFPLSSSRATSLMQVSEEAIGLEYEDDATKQHVYRLYHQQDLSMERRMAAFGI